MASISIETAASQPPACLVTMLSGLLRKASDAIGRCPASAAENIRLALALLHPPPRDGQVRARPILAKGGLAPWQLAKVENCVAANLASRLSHDVLADVVGLSPGHFSRAFKVSAGITPHAYVMGRRIEASKAMMRDGPVALAQIAVACGFADQAHFSHIFRRRVGSTPAAWRRRIGAMPMFAPARANQDALALG